MTKSSPLTLEQCLWEASRDGLPKQVPGTGLRNKGAGGPPPALPLDLLHGFQETGYPGRFYAEGVRAHSPGSRSAPRGEGPTPVFYAEVVAAPGSTG